MSTPTSISVQSSFIIVIPTKPSTPVGEIPDFGSDTDVTLYYFATDSVDFATTNKNSALSFSITAVSQLKQISASMHTRGNSTLTDKKQQYSVKLKSDEKLLGLPTGSHWVLNNAGEVDKSLIRNPLAFFLQNTIGDAASKVADATGPFPWAPHNKYLNLFICPHSQSLTSLSDLNDIFSSMYNSRGSSGTPTNFYYGVYILMEHIRVASNRIDIPNFDHKKPNINIGFLGQINTLHTSEYYQLPTGTGLPTKAEIYEPKEKEFSSTATAPESIAAFNDWYLDSSDATKGWARQFMASTPDFTSIASNTDYFSFAVYFILNEICKDQDGYSKSTYFYKSGDKVYGGPMWDKDKSFGNVLNDTASDSPYTGATGWAYGYDPSNPPSPSSGQHLSNIWIYVLLTDQTFCSQVWDIWTEYFQSGGALSATNLKTFVTNAYDYLMNATSLYDNFAENGLIPLPFDRTTQITTAYNNLLNYLGGYTNDQGKKIQGRIEWMDANLLDLLNGLSKFVPKS